MANRGAAKGEWKPELQMALHFGIAALLTLTGGVLVLMSVGLVETDDPPSGFGRVVAFLFGGAVLAVGIGLVVGPLWLIAHAQGARDGWGALRMGLARLVRRVDARSAGAAALLVPLVAGYAGALQGGPTFGWSRQALIDLVLIEFLLVHGFPFLVFAATIASAPERWLRIGGWTAVLLLSAMYCAFAWGAGGPWGVAELVYLALPNVLAFARAPEDGGIRARAVLRWVVKIVSLVAIAVVLNERSLQGDGNLTLGFFYFSFMALVELFRVIEIPLDLGPYWARVPVQKRRAASLKATDG